MGNPMLARSERDLTKVTKVRVRSAGSARDLTQIESLGPQAGPSGGGQVTAKGPQAGGQSRPKMKTTTMIVSSDPLVPPQHGPVGECVAGFFLLSLLAQVKFLDQAFFDVFTKLGFK